MRTRTVSAISAMAITTAAALALSACGTPEQTGSDDGPSANGVPFGASIEEYHAAFADIEPIALTVQIDGAQGALAGIGRAKYFEALEQWSDGKLEIEAIYATAVAGPTEADDALADGRLDMVNVLPTYEPQVFPLNTGISEASTITGPGGFAGTLIWAASLVDVSYADSKYSEEFEEAGVKMLLPNTPQWATYAQPLMCTDGARQTLDEISGSLVAAAGAAKTAQVEGLGASPVSIPWNEQYEALQRGVVNCTASSTSGAEAAGLYEVAPYLTLDSEVPFSAGQPVMSMGLDRWNELPLVAQQLIFDRLDVLIAEEVSAGIESVKLVVDASIDAGGDLVPLAADARSALAETNEKLLDSYRAAGVDVDALSDAAAKWEQIVDELGYGFDDDLKTVLADYQDGDVDASAFVDRLFEEVLLKHRPE